MSLHGSEICWLLLEDLTERKRRQTGKNNEKNRESRSPTITQSVRLERINTKDGAKRVTMEKKEITKAWLRGHRKQRKRKRKKMKCKRERREVEPWLYFGTSLRRSLVNCLQSEFGDVLTGLVLTQANLQQHDQQRTHNCTHKHHERRQVRQSKRTAPIEKKGNKKTNNKAL